MRKAISQRDKETARKQCVFVCTYEKGRSLTLNLNLQKCVGNNLKFLRTSHLISQQRMEETVNMTRSLYVQYELGNRTPDAEALFNIAQCFEIDMDLFF